MATSLPWVGLVVLIGSHLLVAYTGRNPHWVQYCITLFTLVTLYVLLSSAMRIERRSDRPEPSQPPET